MKCVLKINASEDRETKQLGKEPGSAPEMCPTDTQAT